MTQDNKKRLIHLIGHFQAIAAMEMVDKAAFRKKMIGKWPINPSFGRNRWQMLPLSDFRAGVY